MLFFPYKLDIDLYRLPLLTILVCLVCCATFFSQVRSGRRFDDSVLGFCAQSLDPNLRAMIDAIDDDEFDGGCTNLFVRLRESRDRDARFAQLAAEVRGLEFYRDHRQDLAYKESALRAAYSDFDSLIAKDLTDRLAYRPNRHEVVTMLTSTFAHASLSHLLGNLVFFFIFASCIESALGGLQFAVSFVVMAVVSSLAYAYSVPADAETATIGLSGVAIGMMALLTTLLPRARIWCFFWFILIFRRFRLPVLVIAAWEVGWNIYELTHPDASDRINYMAHVSGAATGLVLGLAYRFFVPDRIEQLAAGANA